MIINIIHKIIHYIFNNQKVKEINILIYFLQKNFVTKILNLLHISYSYLIPKYKIVRNVKKRKVYGTLSE